MRRLALIFLLSTGCLVAACAGSAGYTVTASVASPDLVYAGPGVYAVANADAPVFYADNYYWLYDDGLWYRSSYATGGWVYAPPPYVIRQIDRPLAYQRARTYRRDRQVHVQVIAPAHRVVRDRPPVYQGERGRVEERSRVPAPEPRTEVRERRVPTPAPRTEVRERHVPTPAPRTEERERRPPVPRTEPRDRE